MSLEGKGFYLWKIHRCEGGSVSRIVQRAKSAGLSHVLVKIADGSSAYNVDLAAPLIEALKGAGIQAWGWQFVYGNEPFGEADIAIHRVRTLGLDGFIVNAEVAYKNKHAQASAYMERLRPQIPGVPIGLSSFRYPRYHRDFPWSEFLAHCDINFPQVYWMQASNPAQQTDQSIAQFQSVFPSRPIIPTGAAFAEWGWRPTAGQVRDFLSHARSLGLPAANFWSWDYAGSAEGRDLWDAVASFDWPASARTLDLDEALIDAMNRRDMEKIAGLYQENAILVTASQVFTGHEAIRSYYVDLLGKLPAARFSLETRAAQDNIRHIQWAAVGASSGASITAAQDTIGSRQGLIQFHSSVYQMTSG